MSSEEKELVSCPHCRIDKEKRIKRCSKTGNICSSAHCPFNNERDYDDSY